MSGGDTGAERTQEPTPRKLQEARRRGEVVRSQDVTVLAAYLGALLVLALTAGPAGGTLADLGGTLLGRADAIASGRTVLPPGAALELLQGVGLALVQLVGPPAALVVAALVAQQAVVAAPAKLAPKLSRISPVAGAANKFGPQGLFEFAKSATKMALYGVVVAAIAVDRHEEMLWAAAGDPRGLAPRLAELLAAFLTAVAALAAGFAALDYLWQRHAFLKKQRMTLQDVKDEAKTSEGSPEMKARRRRRAEAIARSAMLRDVAGATVVVTNPTHYAVALRWTPGDPTPPVCVAKGVDAVAARIREAAAAHDVPVFPDPPTARALHATVEIGDPIDRAHFAAVAAAVRFARDLRAKAARS